MKSPPLPNTMTVESLAKRLLERRMIDTNECWIWTGAKHTAGYGLLTLWDGRRKWNTTAHRLAAEIWLGIPRSATVTIRHKCDVPACFNPDHLEPGTQKDNIHDCIARGRFPKGEKNGFAKLKEKDIEAIRSRRAAGELLADIAADYGVSFSLISKVCKGHSWKHVKSPSLRGDPLRARQRSGRRRQRRRVLSRDQEILLAQVILDPSASSLPPLEIVRLLERQGCLTPHACRRIAGILRRAVEQPLGFAASGKSPSKRGSRGKP